jgi:hypothetical protein
MISLEALEKLILDLAPKAPVFRLNDYGENFYRFKAGKLHFLKITFLELLQKYRVTLSHFQAGVKYSKAQIAEFKKNPVARKLSIASLSWSKHGKVVISQKVDGWTNRTYQSHGLASFAKHGMGFLIKDLYIRLNKIDNLGNYICPLALELKVRPTSKYYQYKDTDTMFKKVGIEDPSLKEAWLLSSRSYKTLNLINYLVKRKFPQKEILSNFSFLDHLCYDSSQLLHRYKGFMAKIFKDVDSLSRESASFKKTAISDYFSYTTMLRMLLAREQAFIRRFKYTMEYSDRPLKEHLASLDRMMEDPELKIYAGFINRINGNPENPGWPNNFLEHVRPKPV